MSGTRVVLRRDYKDEVSYSSQILQHLHGGYRGWPRVGMFRANVDAVSGECPPCY